MRQRDRDILNSLSKFKVLSSNQIAALHFSTNSNPMVNCNRVLKRLRKEGYISANTERPFQPYLYFLNPSPIKKNSQKIDHFLMIAQTYIDMKSYDDVPMFEVEKKLEHATFIPDGYANWLDREWFIECQNSLFSTKQLYDKLNKYVQFYNQGILDPFPNVLIIGKINLNLKKEDYPFLVRQKQSIHDLKSSITNYRKRTDIVVSSNSSLKIK